MPPPRSRHINWQKSEIRVSLTKALTPKGKELLNLMAGRHTRLVTLEVDRDYALSDTVGTGQSLWETIRRMSHHEFFAIVPPEDPWVRAMHAAFSPVGDPNLMIGLKVSTQKDTDLSEAYARGLKERGARVALVVDHPTERVLLGPDTPFCGVLFRLKGEEFTWVRDTHVTLSLEGIPYKDEGGKDDHGLPGGKFYNIFDREEDQ